MENKVNRLLKQDNGLPVSKLNSKKLRYTKRKINSICTSLTYPIEGYQPHKTIESIKSYLSSNDKMDRILYSEISNFIFALDIWERNRLNTNIDELIQYILEHEKDVDEDCRKIIIKIYDHSQLVSYQIGSAENIVANGIEEEKIHLESEIKGIEKEYITILGIFASIVLAFVGNFIFSSSVLQNIAKTNIYRLLLTIDFLGFFFATIILVLVRFILHINNRKEAVIRFRYIVEVCAVIAGVILLGWLFQVDRIPEWIVTWVPWGK